MARNLWRPSRFGVPVPVIGIVAGIIVLLVLVVFWVRGGCQKDTIDQPSTPDIPITDQNLLPPVQIMDDATPVDDLPLITDTTTIIKPPPPAPPTLYEKYRDAGRDAFDRGDYVHARNQLSQALKGIKDQKTRKNIQLQLKTISNELTFSRNIAPGDNTVESYHVKSGELPSTIAKKSNISANLFLKINSIPNEFSMRAGHTYKVIKGPFDVVIDKENFSLDVFLGDFYIRSYPIGLGKDNSTPTGTFLAGAKLTKPTWFGIVDETTGRREAVPYGHPSHPLGGHWITLNQLPEDGGKKTDYGIHGTNEPRTIGQQASHGCIRMRNEDVANVFDLLVSGKSRITVLPH